MAQEDKEALDKKEELKEEKNRLDTVDERQEGEAVERIDKVETGIEPQARDDLEESDDQADIPEKKRSIKFSQILLGIGGFFILIIACFIVIVLQLRIREPESIRLDSKEAVAEVNTEIATEINRRHIY